MRFIAFERTSGHCHTTLLNGQTLTHALGNYLAYHWRMPIDERGWLLDIDGAEHPLQFIEREIKANAHNDELALDMETCELVNEQSFEVRVLAEGALEVECACVFTSAEPGYTAGEVVKARMSFARDFPDIDARAFFWYVRDGVLVTFYTFQTGENGQPTMEIVARYLANAGDAWTATPWSGTYDDLAHQMTFELPYRYRSVVGT